MWNEILGALAIVAIVFVGHVVLPAAPKLVDAIADRIRYGVQDPAGETSTAPAPVNPVMPAAAPQRISSKTPTQPAPATTRPAAKPSTTTATGTANKPAAPAQRTAAAA